MPEPGVAINGFRRLLDSPSGSEPSPQLISRPILLRYQATPRIPVVHLSGRPPSSVPWSAGN